MLIGESDDKIVAYHEYCKKCKHFTKQDFEEPCNECLENPVRPGTEVPVKFEKK